jgi:tight adherence protein B
MLDAAARSVQLVQADHQPAGSIVLLTDGADQGSTATLDGVAAMATGAGIRIYTIGLRTSTSDFGALNRLAAATQAEFSPAGSLDDLGRIYGRLGSQLAHQYVIRYRSPAAPSRHVRVDVRVAGFPGVASTSYVTPAAPSHHEAPFHHSPAEILWLRPGAAVGVSVLAVTLLGIALWIVLRPRGRSLRMRMSAYVGLAEPEADRARALTAAAARAGKRTSRRLDGAAWMADLRERLDIGRIDIPAERLVGWVAAAMLATLVLLPLTSGVPATALLAFGVPLGARAYVNHCVRKQRGLFTEQLPDNLQVMASAMRAGHSLAGSLAVVADEAPEPARSEFKRVLADERLGVPVDEALRIAVQRMDSKELEQVALVAALQRDTGGNTAEVLEQVTETVRDRMAIRRLVKTLTAQGRLSRWVLSAIPVGLLVFITAINPDYMRPLYTTPIGHALLVVAAVMVVTGSLIIKRIIDIKV